MAKPKTPKKLTSKRIARQNKKDPGITHGWRSGLEESVAADLISKGTPFEFEVAKLEYTKPARHAKYTPDFFIGKGGFDPRKAKTQEELFSNCIIVETKGRFLIADRQKHLMIKEQYPQLDIRFVFSNSRQRISKTSSTSYALWSQKNGFQYADRFIPDNWLHE